jgi:hypothetical protein
VIQYSRAASPQGHFSDVYQSPGSQFTVSLFCQCLVGTEHLVVGLNCRGQRGNLLQNIGYSFVQLLYLQFFGDQVITNGAFPLENGLYNTDQAGNVQLRKLASAACRMKIYGCLFVRTSVFRRPFFAAKWITTSMLILARVDFFPVLLALRLEVTHVW